MEIFQSKDGRHGRLLQPLNQRMLSKTVLVCYLIGSLIWLSMMDQSLVLSKKLIFWIFRNFQAWSLSGKSRNSCVLAKIYAFSSLFRMLTFWFFLLKIFSCLNFNSDYMTRTPLLPVFWFHIDWFISECTHYIKVFKVSRSVIFSITRIFSLSGLL